MEQNEYVVRALKSESGEMVLEVLGAPFGSHSNKDSQGDYFDAETKIHQDQYPEIPAIYTHGFDPATRKPMDRPEIIGRAKYSRQDGAGHWYQVTLNKANAFAQKIWEAALKGLARASSGAINYLVRRTVDGRLTEWPIAELTLVDLSTGINPANPYAIAVPMLKADYELAGMKIDISELSEDAGDASAQGGNNNNNNLNDKGDEMTKEEEESKKIADEKAAQEAAHALKAANVSDPIIGVLDRVRIEQENALKMKAEREKQESAISEQVKQIVENAMKAAPVENGGAPAVNTKTKRGDNHGDAYEYYLRTGDKGAYKALVIMNEGDDESGGAAVPTDLYGRIIELRDPLSVARRMGAEIINTSRLTINLPTEAARLTAPATTNESAAATAVSRTINEVEPLDTVAVTVVNKTLLLRQSEELLSDSAFDIIEWISSRIGKNYAVLENSLLKTCIYADVSNSVDAADDVTVAAADVFNTYYDLPEQYADGAVWLMKRSTEGTIRQLATTGQFAFGETPQGSTSAAGVKTLLSNPVFNLADMDAVAANKKIVFFGDPFYVKLVQNGTMSIRRLNERYADTGEVGFVASYRIAFKLVGGSETWTYLNTLAS